MAGGAAISVYLGAPGGGTHQATSSQSGGVLMSLGTTPRILGPGITMNYTLSLDPGAASLGIANLSALAEGGLAIRVVPSQVALSGSEVAADVSISAGQNVSVGDHQVGISVVWEGGSANITYHFNVVKHLVLLLGGTTGPGGFFPAVVYAHPQDTITWMSLDAGSDEYGGQRSVSVVGLNASSPTLTLYSTWSYSFASPGTYHISDPLNSVLVAEGTVVVE